MSSFGRNPTNNSAPAGSSDYTASEQAKVDQAVAASHSHANKVLLDTITAAFTTDKDGLLTTVGDKAHEHANMAILEAITVAYTTAKDSVLANVDNLKHEHSNKSILDQTTAVYTEALNAKLSNLDARFRGLFPDDTVAAASISSPQAGYYYLNVTTNTIWVYNPSAGWYDTGTNVGGDMLAVVYDPQNIGADVYDRANHSGTQAQSTVIDLVSDLAAKMATSTYDPQGLAADVFARANHTGTQAISTITGLQDALDSKLSSSAVIDLIPSVGKFVFGTSNDETFHSDSVIDVKSADNGDGTDIRMYNRTGSTMYVTLNQVENDGTYSTNTAALNAGSYRTLWSALGVFNSTQRSEKTEVLITNYGGDTAGSFFCYHIHVYRHDTDEVGIAVIPIASL